MACRIVRRRGSNELAYVMLGEVMLGKEEIGVFDIMSIVTILVFSLALSSMFPSKEEY